MLHKFTALMVWLGVASSRETTKFKQLPAISNSLVNLGKMDISFHFNTKFPDLPNVPVADMKTETISHPSNSFFLSKSEPMAEEPCPCSNIKNFKHSVFSHPSEMLNKLLMSNDLFSNNPPASSVNCCDSHEHVQEDTIFFEFGPKLNPVQSHSEVNVMQPNSMPMLPFIFENLNLLPTRPTLPVQPMKPKAIEIFFFPKKKEMPGSFDFGKGFSKKKDSKKADIQIVGDKELRNDFKNFKFRPSLPIISVLKKDQMAERNLEKIMEKNVEKTLEKESAKTTETPEETSKSTASNPNII